MPLSIYRLLKNVNVSPVKFLDRLAHRKINIIPVGGSYTAVYRFPYVAFCSALNKCKKIQLGAFVIFLPASYISYVADFSGAEFPIIVTSVGVASTVAVFSIGQLFSRLIGSVYISRNQKQVKLAYLDFWGRRKDIICEIQDIIPLKENENAFNKDFLYKTVNICTSDKPFKINLSVGEILNYPLFKDVFKYDLGNTNYS